MADVWSLTPLQEGFLFHALYDENSVDVYNAQTEIELTGDVDPERMRKALQALMDRHPNLRASFRHEGLTRPVQVVPEEVVVPFQTLDYSGLGTSALEEFRHNDQLRRFDMTRSPLLRCSLIKIHENDFRLVFTFHHILLDGWSRPLAIDELLTLYAGSGDATKLPPVTPYRNYLAWLASQDHRAAEDAWSAALAGLEEPTLIARPGHGTQTRLPASRRFEISEETTTALNTLAKRTGVTLNTIIQVAWARVQSLHTGRDDVVFGATVSGRPADLPGIEGMVGLFINTLPVRVKLTPDATVEQLLRTVQREQSELLDHQHLGLASIQKLAGHTQLFDSLLVIQSYSENRIFDLRRNHRWPRPNDDATHYPLHCGLCRGRGCGSVATIAMTSSTKPW